MQETKLEIGYEKPIMNIGCKYQSILLMACQSKEAKKWLCFYLIHLILDSFEVNYLSLPESYNTNLITLYNSSFHKFATMTWSFYQLHLSRNSGSQQSLGPIINNCFIRQRAFFEIWSTRDVWRARKMCKSVHNRNMKHARAIEFDYTNLLAML